MLSGSTRFASFTVDEAVFGGTSNLGFMGLANTGLSLASGVFFCGRIRASKTSGWPRFRVGWEIGTRKIISKCTSNATTKANANLSQA